MTHIYSRCVDCGAPFRLFELVQITEGGWQHTRPCTPARRAEEAAA